MSECAREGVMLSHAVQMGTVSRERGPGSVFIQWHLMLTARSALQEIRAVSRSCLSSWAKSRSGTKTQDEDNKHHSINIRPRRPPWQVALACGLGRAVAPSSHHTRSVACRLISTRSLTMASADHIHLEKKSSSCCPVVRSLDRRLLSTIGRACCGVTRGTLTC